MNVIAAGFERRSDVIESNANDDDPHSTENIQEAIEAEIKNDTLYVEGKPVQHCYFTKDYYWVGANNAINLSDSRLFGFVPEDHIIGKASIIWFSKEKGTGPFSGYRWGKIWKRVE